MSSVWDARAESYRTSATHAAGPDLDLLVEWAGPGEGRTALDVATGGGHLARRLAEAGFAVTSADPSPGMRPDAICRAEDMPFADDSFDVVGTRLAAHHFEDVETALHELVRIARDTVLVEDLLWVDEASEEAEKLRDPSHVRSYTVEEWRALLEGAGVEIEAVETMERITAFGDWLARCGCEGEEAERVRELFGDRVAGDDLRLVNVLLKGRPR